MERDKGRLGRLGRFGRLDYAGQMQMLAALVVILWFSSPWAEEGAEIRTQLAKIKELPPEKYHLEIDSYRVSLERYIEHKKRICEGEFSSVVLSDKATTSEASAPHKLSPAERTLCVGELKSLQISFINHMHTARQRYLNFRH